MDARPLRLQRRRGVDGGYYDKDGNRYVKTANGWVCRTPDGTETPTLSVVYVGRGSKWGNPFSGEKAYFGFMMLLDTFENCPAYPLPGTPRYPFNDIDELRGKHLACWCDFDTPCHADMLLELANKEEGV